VYLLMTMLFVGVGGLVLGSSVYWRFRARRVTGTVVGVRQVHGNAYSAVYEYTDALGRTMQATSTTATPRLRDKRTGARVHLMVFADHPDRVQEVNSYIVDLAGAVFFGLGLWLLHTWRPSWPATRILWIGAGVLLAVIGISRYSRGLATPRDGGGPRLIPEKARARAVPPVHRAEEIIAAPQTRRPSTRSLWKARVGGSMFILFGVAFGGTGVLAARDMMHLNSTGVHALGTVVGMHEKRNDDDELVYHAVVRFSTPGGASAEFEDGDESHTPRYQVGDKVQVLYLSDVPASSAIIDKGVGNWVLSSVFITIGLVIVAAGVAVFRGWSLQRGPASGAGPPPSMDRATPRPTDSEAQPMLGQSYRALGLVLWLLDCALVFSPPYHKSGAAAFGTMLFFLVCALGVLGVLLSLTSSVGSAVVGIATPKESAPRKPMRPFARLRQALWGWELTLMLASVGLLVFGLLGHLTGG